MSYSIGIDFGTASGRVILADTSNGHIISRYEEDYANGTYMNSLYDKLLPENYFLQNADDYLQILEQGVQFVLEDSKVNKTMLLVLESTLQAVQLSFSMNNLNRFIVMKI